jgi:hypothetical protein
MMLIGLKIPSGKIFTFNARFPQVTASESYEGLIAHLTFNLSRMNTLAQEFISKIYWIEINEQNNKIEVLALDSDPLALYKTAPIVAPDQLIALETSHDQKTRSLHDVCLTVFALISEKYDRDLPSPPLDLPKKGALANNCHVM